MFIPRYLDRPRLIVFFEVDTVAWALGSFGVTFGVLFMTSLWSIVIMGVSALFGVISALLYVKYKREFPVGYAKHLLYSLGLRHPLMGKEKDEELERIGHNGFLPRGDTIEFWG
jgi:hypothetical protein